MRSSGINGGELNRQPANRGSPVKMAVKTVCTCVTLCVLTTATSIISCLSKPQNGSTFWCWITQLSWKQASAVKATACLRIYISNFGHDINAVQKYLGMR